MLNPKLINDPNGCCHRPIYMSCPARRQGLTKLSCLLSCNHRHLSQFLARGLLPDLCQHCPLDTDQNSGKLSSKHHLLFIGIKMLLENHILFTSYNCIIFIFAKIKKTRKEVDFFFTNFTLNIFCHFHHLRMIIVYCLLQRETFCLDLWQFLSLLLLFTIEYWPGDWTRFLVQHLIRAIV